MRGFNVVSGAAVAAVCLLSPFAGASESGASLQLSSAPQEHSASLFGAPDELPASVQLAMLGDIASSLNAEVRSFSQTLDDDAAAGGGDGSGALALIAGILGFFPGFGLGHLISGHINGFLLFLTIDIVLAAVFWIAFPVWGFAFWYLPGVIVFVVERVVEAFCAADAATRPVYAELPSGVNDGRSPVQAGLRILSF